MALNKAKTKYGVVVGARGNNSAITVFRGVPYAKAPVGIERFLPPKEPEPWDGERLCDRFSPVSLQPSLVAGVPFGDFFRKEFYPVPMPMSSDSLYLNIWTPAETTDEKRPVMFWIHGGGLSSGYGHEMEFDGEALAKHGVILVTLNYRLGALGFFAHPELSRRNASRTSGNNVILDQIMALRWVQENIAQFGGDPDNVTVFGQSGGAAATTDHMISPLSEGLFHKAIPQSGVSGINMPVLPPMPLDYAEGWGVKACEVLGLTLEELVQLDDAKLVEGLEYAEQHGAGMKPFETVDGYVFHTTFREAATTGGLRDLPMLTGATTGDYAPIMAPRIPGKPEATEAECSAYYHVLENYPAFLERFPPQQHPDLYETMRTDRSYITSMSFGEQQARHGRRMPYIYYFDAYMPGGDEFNFCGDGVAYHSADLWFTFGTLGRCWRPFDGRYYDLSEKMVSYWTNFARTGNPNGPGLAEWRPYESDRKSVMLFSEQRTRCADFGENEHFRTILSMLP